MFGGEIAVPFDWEPNLTFPAQTSIIARFDSLNFTWTQIGNLKKERVENQHFKILID